MYLSHHSRAAPLPAVHQNRGLRRTLLHVVPNQVPEVDEQVCGVGDTVVRPRGEMELSQPVTVTCLYLQVNRGVRGRGTGCQERRGKSGQRTARDKWQVHRMVRLEIKHLHSHSSHRGACTLCLAHRTLLTQPGRRVEHHLLRGARKPGGVVHICQASTPGGGGGRIASSSQALTP